MFGMDSEKTLAKYSSHKVVNDINNVVLEQSQPNEKTTKEKLVLGFENNALWTRPWRNFFQYFEIMVSNGSMNPETLFEHG